MEHASLLIITLPCGFLVSAVSEFALLQSVTCVQLRLIILGKCGCQFPWRAPRPSSISNVDNVLVFRGIKGTSPVPHVNIVGSFLKNIT
jgi:hypothetical protein